MIAYSVFPGTKCKLRQLKLERIKDFLLMEQEFIQNQEILRPKEASDKVRQGYQMKRQPSVPFTLASF